MAIEDLDLEFEDEQEEKKSDALEIDVDLSFSANDDEDSNSSASSSAKKPTVNANSIDIDQSIQPKTNPKSNISEDDVTDPNLRIPNELHKPQAPKSPTPKDSQAQASVKTTSAASESNSQKRNVSDINEARKKAMSSQPSRKQELKNTTQIESAPEPIQVPSTEPTPNRSEQVDVNNVLVKELEFYREEVQKLRADMNQLKEELFDAKKDSEIKVAVAQMKTEIMVDVLSGGKIMEHKVNQIIGRIHKKVPALKGEVITIKKAIHEYLEEVKKKN